MDIGIFQLLSQPEGVTDQQVIEQAFWEVDFAEANGYDTVWVTEHHLSEYGIVGTPSVYAAAIAQRTKRLRIGYGVAVLPLHHPVRLAEEIAWVDHLSQGRLWVGVGPGFSPYEFDAFGVSLEERSARTYESLHIIKGLLSNDVFSYEGKFWNVPPVKLKPRPYTQPLPPLMLASSSEDSLVQAANHGLPPLIGFRPNEEIGKRVQRYREIRLGMGVPAGQVEVEVGQMGVLRRVHVAETDAEARANVVPPLMWYTALGKRVHRRDSVVGRDPATGKATAAFTAPQVGSLPDGSVTGISEEEVLRNSEGGMIAGSPETVARQLKELANEGIGHVIAWMNFGNLDYGKVRRSMELLASDVIPALKS